MRNNKGFSLSEVIIAMGVLLMLVATALPIHQQITTDQFRMKQHQLIKLSLHNELQKYILNDKPPAILRNNINGNDVQMSFMIEGEYVKGCAKWENVRKEKEKACLYGIQEE